MFSAPLPLYRTTAIAEAVSWTLLLGGIVVRAVWDAPIAVTIGGGVHGLVFLAYATTAVLVSRNQRWGLRPTVIAIGSAVVPYATIPTEIWLHRSGRLDGAWRLAATDDPRDATWHDRLLRASLARPWLLGLVLVAAVVALYVILLVVGPPGGER